MGKKILLPTDFSKSSWNAIQYAIKLFEGRDCDFYILNTYMKDTHGLNSYTLLDPDEAFNKLSEKRSKSNLGDILIKLSLLDTENNHRFHVLSRSVPLVETIKNLVNTMKIDMIVMGAKGFNDKEGKYGKNTLDVIENIRKCPIMVVPKNVTLERLKEIVLATNFNVDFNECKIKYLVEIAKINNASVQVLSLSNNKKQSKQQKKNKSLLKEHLKGVDYSFNILHNVKLSTALSCFVDIRHSNMISYINKKPSLWELLGFGKRNLGKLGYFKDVPVLALHE
ncbi:universal stress protein [Aurantibacter crassamenti]|uniref:universal stress protein n=1 Tax=Aurantibacter crassamenti TaxID=1837375 RepID=UPI00193AA324|nr:universal stress protein [Aurantibacter crassamenti]MBM1107645.1 universal stress protein [Aurantibacter crassamenti]